MAAAVQVMHSSASSSHQQTPSTALVLEFVCLFTRDLRRKQKRWQDGRLKYHTYNKRVMVYDDGGNFVGDTHWREDYDLNDGDEVELERGGVIVQVAECTGSRDQDLSELVDKRAQEKAERQAAALARRPPALESVATTQAVTPHFQLRHKPLHHLIGMPTGHHDHAPMPTESPYEERQKLAKSPQNNSVHPAKRRKREVSPPSKSGYAQSLFGAALTLSGTPASTPAIRNRPSKAFPDLDHHDEDVYSTSAPIRRITTATTVHKERPIPAPRTTLSSKIPKQGAVMQGLKQKGESSSHVIEDNSPQSISMNLNTTDQETDRLDTARHRSKRDMLDDHTSLITRPETSTPKPTSRDEESQTLTELRIRPRKKRGLLMVSENLETRGSSSSRAMENRALHQNASVQDVTNYDHNMDDPPDASHIPRRPGPSDESFPLLGISSTKPKSRKRHTLTGEENEDVQYESDRVGTASRSRHDKINDRRTTTLERAHGNAIVADASRSPKRREYLSRQEKTLIDDIINPSVAERHNEKQTASDEDYLLPGSVAPPRLAHLGRKSIRSKEVIGFIFDEETNDQRRLSQSGDGGRCGKGSLDSDLSANHSGVQATTSEPSHTDSATMKDNRIDASDQCPNHPLAKEGGVVEEHTTFRSIDHQNTGTTGVKATSKSLIQSNAPSGVQTPVPGNTTAVSRPPSRMAVNPATRGKKAVKPSDAAGQVPQCPLPSEATGENPSISKRHENDGWRSRLENWTKETPLAPMPGFAKANGGPWSREAHDLFEFTRPL
ncbi:hypothetical protein F5B19DRAFT_501997 [Rostrohypoxylon terebratum]|nr:hypothetical protein F5B19DRAFT_501997 [Rostrohypoxylon terebratum]